MAASIAARSGAQRVFRVIRSRLIKVSNLVFVWFCPLNRAKLGASFGLRGIQGIPGQLSQCSLVRLAGMVPSLVKHGSTRQRVGRRAHHVRSGPQFGDLMKSEFCTVEFADVRNGDVDRFDTLRERDLGCFYLLSRQKQAAGDYGRDWSNAWRGAWPEVSEMRRELASALFRARSPRLQERAFSLNPESNALPHLRQKLMKLRGLPWLRSTFFG